MDNTYRTFAGDDRGFMITATTGGEWVIAGSKDTKLGDFSNKQEGFDRWVVKLDPGRTIVGPVPRRQRK